NYLAAEVSKSFDKNGAMAAAGEVNVELLKALTSVNAAFRKKRPSLGREIFEKQIEPLLKKKTISHADRLRTFTESIAIAIWEAIRQGKANAKMLCTGGDAFNAFLITRILELVGDDVTLIIPDDDVVKFKEAMVFGFLG